MSNPLPIEIAPGLACLTLAVANVYFVGRPEGWVLVDTALTGSERAIRAAAEARFERGARPAAILLTHGHGDHSGSARALADGWDVPIYAHRTELPYLDGRSDYPPGDPTVGGLVAVFGRVFRPSRIDLGDRLRALPADGPVPGLEGWEIIETPGHSPGHVSFFRPEDGALLAGDACATVDLSGWTGPFRGQQVAGPPPPFTPDWVQAQRAIETLAALPVQVLGCGHGQPLTSGDVSGQLRAFSAAFRPPAHGRYVREPARWDENGIVSLPPAPFDPLPYAAAGLGIAALTLGALAARRKGSSRNEGDA